VISILKKKQQKPPPQYVDGPSVVGFDTTAFVNSHPGWLKDYSAYAGGDNHTGAEIVDMVAIDYSISPRVLLALLEYQTGALSQPVAPTGDYPLGNVDYNYAGFYLQLIWAANILNVGYYGWRSAASPNSTIRMAPSNARILANGWHNRVPILFFAKFAHVRIHPRHRAGWHGARLPDLVRQPICRGCEPAEHPCQSSAAGSGFSIRRWGNLEPYGRSAFRVGNCRTPAWSALDFGPPVKAAIPTTIRWWRWLMGWLSVLKPAW